MIDKPDEVAYQRFGNTNRWINNRYSFLQILTSASRLHVRSARRVWTRLTATAACVHPGEPEQGVRKVNACQFNAGLLSNSFRFLFEPGGHMTRVGFSKQTSLHGQRAERRRRGEVGQGL